VRRLLALALVLAAGTPRTTTGQTPDAEAAFALKVLPVLKAKCVVCHGEDRKKLKGGLDLTTRTALLKGGDSGPAVVGGKPGDSPLLKAVARTDADVPAMPPKEADRLSDAEVAAVRDWIAGGAPWPSDARVAEIVKAAKLPGVTVKTSGGLSPDWTNRTYKPEDLWAYRPLTRPAVPAGAANPVDAFVNARLAALGLTPAPPADRRTLIRRVTFDLTGLPPTAGRGRGVRRRPADRRSRVRGGRGPAPGVAPLRRADGPPLARPHPLRRQQRVRQRLRPRQRLAVPRLRRAELQRRQAVRRFVREQLAGDEIDEADPELLVAVGFLRMGPWELTGMEVAKVARQRFLDDVTDAVGQVFLGHMLQCARCHDHKFDPVPTRDYYRIQAAFATTQPAERAAPFLPAENTAGFGERKYLDARKAALGAELARVQKAEAAARAKWEAAHPDKAGQKPPRHEFLSAADLGVERVARKGLERLKWEYDRYEPFALSVYAGRTPALKAIYAPFRVPKDRAAGELEACHVLAGGDPFSPTQPVAPGVLSAAGEAAIPDAVGGRRKALAEWITGPTNPLTARVMANRVWQWTMGAPLAGNPNNFGVTGKKPTHPELLDWLASEFVANGWSVKKLQRQILLSDAYRRSSRHPDPRAVAAKDPAGTSYAAFKPRRLAAEELRDAMLAASGELNRAVGGIPVRPEIHPDVALQPRQVMGTFAAAWEPSPLPEQRHRRTLYALKLRGVRDPLLEVFNAPGPDLSCEAREVSTVAPQAFALFNGANTRGRALALAARVTRAAKAPDEAVALAFRHAYGRAPTPAEAAACLAHWRAMTERHRGLKLDKPTRPTTLTRRAVEENTGEPFTFAEALPAAADFVPDLHPADVSAEVRGLMEVCLVLFNGNEFAYLD
jgi:mono/diheme cytochrome c family protein